MFIKKPWQDEPAIPVSVLFNSDVQLDCRRALQTKPGHALLDHVDFEQIVSGPGRSINFHRQLYFFTGSQVVEQCAAPIVVCDYATVAVEPMVTKTYLKWTASAIAA